MTMLKRLLILSLLLAFALSPAASLTAAGPDEACMNALKPGPEHYMHSSQVDLVEILGPPPLADSPAGKADLAAVIEAQRTVTPAEKNEVQADNCFSIIRFSDVMGSGFESDKLPFTIAFFQRIFSDEQNAIEAAKKQFNRPRPFVADPAEIKPLVEQPNNASYPSGHATFAYVTAILLATMVPEKAHPLFDRAALFAHHRVIAGVHYPADIEAGRIAGSVIDNVLLHDVRFEADLEKSCNEVRHALGLPWSQLKPSCASEADRGN
ncbi:MAG: phosphatase PAP2 family protein [Candidatus Binataceae bacterium]|jgi:acid phosphatase (class A)